MVLFKLIKYLLVVVVLYLVLSLHGAVVDSGRRRRGGHGPVGDGPSASAIASPSRSHHPVAVVVPDANAVHGGDGGGRRAGGA